MVALFGEWIYKTSVKTDKEITQIIKQKEKVIMYDNVFKGLNASKRYPKETHHRVEVLTSKD